jgi:hypothetical protein
MCSLCAYRCCEDVWVYCEEKEASCGGTGGCCLSIWRTCSSTPDTHTMKSTFQCRRRNLTDCCIVVHARFPTQRMPQPHFGRRSCGVKSATSGQTQGTSFQPCRARVALHSYPRTRVPCMPHPDLPNLRASVAPATIFVSLFFRHSFCVTLSFHQRFHNFPSLSIKPLPLVLYRRRSATRQ